jgi:hypothetical protein
MDTRMLVKFQKLNAAQFDDYRSYFIADYGQEISFNFRVPLAQALVQAETALERKLMDRGVTQLKLRVAFENTRALALYQAVGFNITGLNMAKTL